MKHNTYRDYDRYLLEQARNQPRLMGSTPASPVVGAAAPPTQSPIRHAAQYLGRDQGAELIYSGAWATTAGQLNVQLIPKALNINRPLKKLIIRVQWTSTLATAAYTTVNAESPQNVLQNVRLTGTHAKFGALVPINMSGATLWMRGQLRKRSGSHQYVNLGAGGFGIVRARQVYQDIPGAGAYGTLAAPGTGITVGAGIGPLVPLLSPSSTSWSTLADSPQIWDIFYELDFAPMFGPWSRMAKLPFSLRPEDWGDSLQLQLTFGDMNAIGTIAASADNTASLQTYSVYGVYDLLGKDYVDKISPAVLILNEQSVPTPAASGNNQRLAILQKQKTTGIIVKTGVLGAYALIGPNVVFRIMDDTILEQTQVIADTKPVHNNLSNMTYRDNVEEQNDITHPQGYFLVDFCGSQNPLTYYRGDKLAGAATFEIDTNITATPPANYGISMVQEIVIGEPALG
jgi:hypothetical protein